VFTRKHTKALITERNERLNDMENEITGKAISQAYNTEREDAQQQNDTQNTPRINNGLRLKHQKRMCRSKKPGEGPLIRLRKFKTFHDTCDIVIKHCTKK
jgi:hypothetical protein